MKRIFSLAFSILLFVSLTNAQQAEVTIQLNEPFFDALLDAIFKNANPPSFPLAQTSPQSKVRSPESEAGNLKSQVQSSNLLVSSFSGNNSPIENRKSKSANFCDESIKLQREIDGVKTAVRFREGRIYAPLAFAGNYNPPLIGCVEFSGWAETYIELSFDKEKQALVGRAQIANVQLSGTNGLGSSLITKLVQNSIDKKLNPIQILPLDKVSFVVPIQNSGSVKMKAVGMRPEITNGVLNIHIIYEFSNS